MNDYNPMTASQGEAAGMPMGAADYNRLVNDFIKLAQSAATSDGNTIFASGALQAALAYVVAKLVDEGFVEQAMIEEVADEFPLLANHYLEAGRKDGWESWK